MMITKNTLNKIVIFASGAITGSVATYMFVKKKFERITQEEIDSVKEYYANKSATISTKETSSEETEEEAPVFDEEDVAEYKKIIEKCNYATESNNNEIQNKKEVEKEMDRPYVLSPEEYAESENECITMHYYANDVLVDEFGGVISKDIWEEYVGEDFASNFGKYGYDPDTVYIRNETFGIDYEILKELSDYTGDN